MRARIRKILKITGVIALVYALFCLALIVNQRSFIYIPFPGAVTPEAAKLDNFARREITAPDGKHILYWESTGDAHEPTLLYFHGNAGGLHMFTGPLDYLNTHGFHVVAMEYRGYPDAPKGITQTLIVGDGVALFDALKKANPKKPIAIWGWSLGSGVATQVASQRAPSALVLESPFTAVVDRAKEMFPYLPVRSLMRDTYISRDAIKNVHAPLLILHGGEDLIVPLSHGKALYDAANMPKTILTYLDFDHHNLIESPGFPEAVRFLKKNAK